MSGGRATFQLRQDIINRSQAGDMTAISPEGIDLCERYVWEYKHRDNLNFTAFLTGCGGLLTDYWLAVQRVAKRVHKLPVLIAKQNRYPAVVITPVDCRLFSYDPWAIFPALNAEVRDFEIVTRVHRPTLKRPVGRNEAAQARYDPSPVVQRRNGGTEAR
jgi:hypothetical protein